MLTKISVCPRKSFSIVSFTHLGDGRLTFHSLSVKRKCNGEIVSEDSDAEGEDSDDEESDLSDGEDNTNLLEISEGEPVSIKPCVLEQG